HNIIGSHNKITIYHGGESKNKSTGEFQEMEDLPEIVTFALGEKGMTAAKYTKSLRDASHPSPVIIVDGLSPIGLYLKDNVLLADVKLWSGESESPVEIKGNKFIVKRPGWDRNFTANAFEVVDENGSPVFQMIRKTKYDFVFKGILVTPRLIFVADQACVQLSAARARDIHLSLTPIFKYPSWKFPGKYADGSN